MNIYRPLVSGIAGALLVLSGVSVFADGYSPFPGDPVSSGYTGAPMPSPNVPYPAGVAPPIALTNGVPAMENTVGPTLGAAPAWQPKDSAGSNSLMPPADAPVSLEKLVQSSWYTRVDYYHWNERSNSIDLVNISGTLLTVGYQRQIGIERFRAEVFGGDMLYKGYGQFDFGFESLTSSTRYLGCGGEYEVVLAPPGWEDHFAFLLGIGARMWIRDIRDGVGDLGDAVSGYQETWATIYPYVGLESKLRLTAMFEAYSDARIGMTAVNYDFAEIMDVPLWPKSGIFAQVEMGIRSEHLTFATYCELMTFTASSVVEDSFQPSSQQFTVGARFGFMF